MASTGPRLISNNGILYWYDLARSKVLSVDRKTLRYSIRSRTVKNQFARLEDGTPTMSVGDFINRNATITGLSAVTEIPQTWDVEIYKNSDTVPIAILNLNTEQFKNGDYNVDVASGDILHVKASGENIQFPIITIELAWRL
jgi:hypothetical protein